jgi:hypothetical protein
MASIIIHVGGHERLELAITKATPLSALGTEALVWIGATSIRGPAAALRALADALVEAAELADDYDLDPDTFNERKRAKRDRDARPRPHHGRRDPAPGGGMRHIRP